MARIADEAGAVPAALYRHFASADELFDGVLARVLDEAPRAVRSRGDWTGQLRAWMQSVRERLLRVPAVLPLLGRRGRTSPAWLEVMAAPVAILERAGFSGAALARAQLFVGEVTMGVVLQEASLALPDQIAGLGASLGELSAESRARFEPLLPHLSRLDADAFFAFVCDCTIAALAAQLRG